MRPAAELLVLEAEALPAVLARYETAALDRPTALPGWRVRDVVAHCGAALTRLVAGDDLDFSPEANWADVEERRTWPLDVVVAELVDGYRPAAEAIEAAGGAFDGLGLGEWIHGGDIREPLGEPEPYAGAGIDLAVPLLFNRAVTQELPAVRVDLDGRTATLGVGEPTGRVLTDPETLVRLCAGRNPDPERYEIHGVDPSALLMFF